MVLWDGGYKNSYCESIAIFMLCPDAGYRKKTGKLDNYAATRLTAFSRHF
jgi:hypothetical protein